MRIATIKRWGIALMTLVAVAAALAQSPTGVLELISVSSAEVQGNADSGTSGFTTPSNDRASITADGRFVAFMSLADNLVPEDTNLVADVFVRDRLTGTTERVSVSSKGRQGDGHSGVTLTSGADISDDGRFVVFASQATNFARGDVNGNDDVFLHDRVTRTTELVSRGLDGAPATGDSPVISADGRFVAFRSFSDTLVSDGNPNFTTHIYVDDRDTQSIERVDVATSGALGESQAGNVVISADGRYVAFDTFSDNLLSDAPGDQQGVDVFVRDRMNGTTHGVSTVGDTGGFEGHSFLASITPDGLLVGFSSADPTLGAENTSGFIEDAFVSDWPSGTVQLVSRDSAGNQGDDSSFSPLVSADGNAVIFSSRATNLVGDDTNGVYDVFRRDLVAGTTERLAADDNGFDVIGSDMTPDGRVVSLLTRADLLLEQDVGFFAMDVYVLDMRPATDLALTKTDALDPVAVRANLTYTVTVQNLGPGAAGEVTLTDQLPAEAVFVSATASQGSCTRAGSGSRDGELTCALGTINAFGTATVTIVVSPSRGGVTLTNTATVRATSSDPNAANNTATETTTVLAK